MQELFSDSGVRHCFGDDFVIAQAEALEPLQQLLSNFGAVIVSGCAVTPAGGGAYDIAAGIVAIRHADGFKVARFAGVSAVNLPGIITITKTTQTGNYGPTGSITVKDISYTYTAGYTFSAPIANNDTELVVPDPPAQPKRLTQGLTALTNTTKQTFNISTADAEGYINIVVNRAARLMYINGSIEFKNVAAWAFPVTEIELVSNASLSAYALTLSNAGELAFDSTFKVWQGITLHNTGALPEGTGGYPISSVNIKMTGNTIIAEARKTVSGAGYYVFFNEALTLDL